MGKRIDIKPPNWTKELTFEEIVSDREIIKVKLFESESDLFIQNLKKCDLYGEYGSGISTIYAGIRMVFPLLMSARLIDCLIQ